MRPLRRFIASDFGQRFVAGLIVLYTRIVFRTTRWRRLNTEVADRLLRDQRRGLVCFWHNRLLMMPYLAVESRRFHLLTSDHRDGQLIAQVVRHFGIDVFHGSSSRRPIQTLLQAAEISAAGGIVCMAPDGPRGPRMRAAFGPVIAAGLVTQRLESEHPAGVASTNAVLVPISYATSRRRTLNSWDRFLLPLPFGHGVFVLGKEIEVPADLDSAGREALRLRLEDSLNAVTAEADRLTGHPPVDPAPVS